MIVCPAKDLTYICMPPFAAVAVAVAVEINNVAIKLADNSTLKRFMLQH